jgi:hypothetical protein
MGSWTDEKACFASSQPNEFSLKNRAMLFRRMGSQGGQYGGAAVAKADAAETVGHAAAAQLDAVAVLQEGAGLAVGQSDPISGS